MNPSGCPSISGIHDRRVSTKAKARELAEAIGLGGKLIPCDGGAIWLRRGSPWCQNIADESDENIKRRYVNVTGRIPDPELKGAHT